MPKMFKEPQNLHVYKKASLIEKKLRVNHQMFSGYIENFGGVKNEMFCYSLSHINT